MHKASSETDADGRAAGRVLIVDDDREMCALIVSALGRAFRIASVTSGSEALAALEVEDFDVVVTDLRMPHASGLELCSKVKARWPEVPVVVMTAFGSLDTAIQAIRAGAYDFLTKPFEMEELRLLLDRVVLHRALTREVMRLREAVRERRKYEGLTGDSPAMAKVFELIERVAASESSVLITGESGTGKEIVARTLHEESRRAGGPFVAINCAAMPEALLESELFGHEKGAFTDALRTKPGLFVEANGGTLFLDEIGDMPLSLQAKLLRSLQERKVRPVGGSREVSFDARVIAATHRDLETMIEEGQFRQDFYYRINVITIPLPPLRERGTDVLLLAQRFVAAHAERSGKPVSGISEAAAAKLVDYPWPGNVRELQNCIERAIALTRHREVMVEDLPEKIRSHRPAQVVFSAERTDDIVPLEEVEKRYILKVYEAAGKNRTLASQLLGVDRKTLYRKLDKYGARE